MERLRLIGLHGLEGLFAMRSFLPQREEVQVDAASVSLFFAIMHRGRIGETRSDLREGSATPLCVLCCTGPCVRSSS